MLQAHDVVPVDPTFIDQMACHFPNQVTAYVYIESDILKLDVKGLSGRTSLQNQTFTPATCEEALHTLKALKALQPSIFRSPGRRAFHHQESVAIVESEQTCEGVGTSLNNLGFFSSATISPSSSSSIEHAMARGIPFMDMEPRIYLMVQQAIFGVAPSPQLERVASGAPEAVARERAELHY